ncbi:sugar-transfer associated ATP-grasp domain-containing protein [Winogradskyella flava]|uniref:Alpha-L-glutamate ligase-related protein ATP-grasp domain-containing protein n=1 Tax=Winogradskyella flava TaxID=1884876 RepID=A0A842IPC1_9FLAO|nr:sugar-transfer associated ATP-grasp domain-containing protein [Winogradskyella flava]MBC2843663.1 hypothetical protein [Winogradskyella flava]
MNRFKVFLKDPNKKSFLKIIKEVVILIFIKKEIPFYYFKYLYRQNVDNYLDYLSLKEQRKLQDHKRLHNPEYVEILDNKLKFALFGRSNDLAVPKMVGYNLKSKLFCDAAEHQISDLNQLILSYKKLYEDHKVNQLFFRPLSGSGGKGCFKLSKSNLESELKQKGDTILNSEYIYTKVVAQHQSINQIHEKSINTLRLVTLITLEGTCEIISAFMRFGIGTSVVDNASSGGFFVGINHDDGTLKPKGHFLPQYGAQEIYEHPDSGFKFEGFKIPFYKEACETVINGVKALPNRFIGWDVAISDKGPVIIEANTKPHMQMSNIAEGGMLKNKHVKNVMAELS